MDLRILVDKRLADGDPLAAFVHHSDLERVDRVAPEDVMSAVNRVLERARFRQVLWHRSMRQAYETRKHADLTMSADELGKISCMHLDTKDAEACHLFDTFIRVSNVLLRVPAPEKLSTDHRERCGPPPVHLHGAVSASAVENRSWLSVASPALQGRSSR